MAWHEAHIYTVSPWKESYFKTFSRLGSLVPFSSRQPPSIKRTQDKLVQLFSVVLLYVAWKRGFPGKFARFVLFRLIKKKKKNTFF